MTRTGDREIRSVSGRVGTYATILGPGLFVRHLRVELTQECKSDTNRSL